MESQKTGLKFLLAAISGILIFFSFPGLNFYYLEWAAFIPLFFALEGVGLLQAYLLGLTCGFAAMSGGFYWMGHWAWIVLEIPFPFNFLVVPLFALYAGQMFALTALAFQHTRRSKLIGDIFLFPIVQVFVFSVFPMLFDFRLGEGQSFFLSAIQAVDHTGIYGLDFIISLSNILLYKGIRAFEKENNRLSATGAFIIILAWFAYGGLSLRQWDKRTDSWEKKKIGLVQPNRPASISRPKRKAKSKHTPLYPLEMEISEKLARKGADIIFWPEGHFFGYSRRRNIRDAIHSNIKKMGVPVVFYDATYKIENRQRRAYNTSLWIDENGNFRDQYHKIRLVPFGEYTPLIGNIDFIKEALGGFLSNLSPGNEHKTFETAGMKIVPKICYEITFPEFTAESIGSEGRGKALLVQTQDGWYGESGQPEQHTAVSVLRAVENRTPLIHVINNGPSSVVLPQGRRVFSTPPFTRGGWIVELPYNARSGGSFYSEHPFLFVNTVRALFVALLLSSLGGKLNLFSLKRRR